MGKVARPFEDLQPAVGHGLMRPVGVGDRDDPIVSAPHHQTRDLIHQVEAVSGADALTATINDTTQSVEERTAALRIGERGARPHGLDHTRGRPDAHSTRQPAHHRRRSDHVPVCDQRDQVLTARKCSGPQRDADISAESPAGHQDEPFTAFRVLVGELHGDATAERVTDHRRGPMTQRVEEVAETAGVRLERVVASWRRGTTMPRQIHGDHRASRRETFEDRVPRSHRAGEAVHQDDHRTRTDLPKRNGPTAHSAALDTTDVDRSHTAHVHQPWRGAHRCRHRQGPERHQVLEF